MHEAILQSRAAHLEVALAGDLPQVRALARLCTVAGVLTSFMGVESYCISLISSCVVSKQWRRSYTHAAVQAVAIDAIPHTCFLCARQPV